MTPTAASTASTTAIATTRPRDLIPLPLSTAHRRALPPIRFTHHPILLGTLMPSPKPSWLNDDPVTRAGDRGIAELDGTEIRIRRTVVHSGAPDLNIND